MVTSYKTLICNLLSENSTSCICLLYMRLQKYRIPRCQTGIKTKKPIQGSTCTGFSMF